LKGLWSRGCRAVDSLHRRVCIVYRRSTKSRENKKWFFRFRKNGVGADPCVCPVGARHWRALSQPREPIPFRRQNSMGSGSLSKPVGYFLCMTHFQEGEMNSKERP
jgi:hypothetical protein